jgi:ribosome-binding protein aMBF1 (putative translation factor)
MIDTQQRYEATKRRIADFEEALAHAEDDAADRDPLLQSVLRKNIEDELQTMYEQLADYEHTHLQDLPAPVLTVGTDLPTILIRSRILAGLRQADLAEHTGITEQQIRQYEATRFAGADDDQLRAIADVLGIEVDIDSSNGNQIFVRSDHTRLPNH